LWLTTYYFVVYTFSIILIVPQSFSTVSLAILETLFKSIATLYFNSHAHNSFIHNHFFLIIQFAIKTSLFISNIHFDAKTSKSSKLTILYSVLNL
jgi:hypothetical protein